MHRNSSILPKESSSCPQRLPFARANGLPACWMDAAPRSLPFTALGRGEGERSFGPLTPPRPGRRATKTFTPATKGTRPGPERRPPCPACAQSHLGKKPSSGCLARFTVPAGVIINLNKGNLSPKQCFCNQPCRAWKHTSLFPTLSVFSFPERQHRHPCFLMEFCSLPSGSRSLHSPRLDRARPSLICSDSISAGEAGTTFGHEQSACKVPEACRLINTGPIVGCFPGCCHLLALSASLTHGSSTLGKSNDRCP